MARAKIPPTQKKPKPQVFRPHPKTVSPEKPALVVHSLTLTHADEEILEHLSKDVSDYTGRTISGSAVLRALLRHADRQGYQWFLAQVSPFIEAEMTSGILWGKQK
jgi:hypothetical protein